MEMINKMSELKSIDEIEIEITRCKNRIDEISETIHNIIDLSKRGIPPLNLKWEQDELNHRIKVLNWVLNKGDI